MRSAPGHDVEVGQHLTARVEHDAGADAERVLIVDLGVDACDGRLDLGRSGDRVAGSGTDVAGFSGATSARTATSASQQRSPASDA